MARTAKLSDLQLVLLATAAQRPDRSLLPPPEHLGDQAARIRRAIPPLLRRKLAAEIAVTRDAQVWREEGDRRLGLVITDAGWTLIAAEEADGLGNAEVAPPLAPDYEPAPSVEPPPPAPGAGTKQALLVTLLRRDEGASIAELMAGTGWQPHTTRAALTSLRKRGFTLRSEKETGGSRYWIDAA